VIAITTKGDRKNQKDDVVLTRPHPDGIAKKPALKHGGVRQM
jgi:hypothetical protein